MGFSGFLVPWFLGSAFTGPRNLAAIPANTILLPTTVYDISSSLTLITNSLLFLLPFPLPLLLPISISIHLAHISFFSSSSTFHQGVGETSSTALQTNQSYWRSFVAWNALPHPPTIAVAWSGSGVSIHIFLVFSYILTLTIIIVWILPSFLSVYHCQLFNILKIRPCVCPTSASNQTSARLPKVA